MDIQPPAWTLGELATLLGGELHGAADVVIRRPVPSDSTDPEGITFCESPEYLESARISGVAALLLPEGLQIDTKPYITVASPRQAFGRLLGLVSRPLPINTGIHPTAVVDPMAIVEEGASVGPYAVIERGSRIGSGAKIFAFTYIGENCIVGENAILFPHVVLYQDVEVGPRAILHSGAVIGADGFGFGFDGTKRIKVPQVGGVVLGADVEIGAVTTVDRATAGTTEIGEGSKIDNQVQIGHNTRIGKHSVIASQTGISGSSQIGDRVTMGGQCAVGDHATIGNDVTFGGRTGTSQDIAEPGVYFGAPARPISEGMRTYLLAPKLPEMFSRLRKLEKRLEKLEKDEE